MRNITLTALVVAGALLTGCNATQDPAARRASDSTPTTSASQMSGSPDGVPGKTVTSRTTQGQPRNGTLATGMPTPKPSSLTPSEARYLLGSAVSTDRVQETLTGGDFARALREMTSENAGNRDAQDLTQQYRAAIESQLGRTGSLLDLACGESVCLGLIRTKGGNAAYTRWSDLFFKSKQTPNYVFTDSSVELGAGEFDNRFFFSTDPTVNSTITRR